MSSHDSSCVLVFAHPARDENDEPACILRGARCPHGLRFAFGDRRLLVADAAAPYVHVFEPTTEGWADAAYPTSSIRVLDDATFARRRRNRYEGGPKGIDVLADDVLVLTCEGMSLAFFDLARAADDGARDLRLRYELHVLDERDDFEQVAADLRRELDAMRQAKAWKLSSRRVRRTPGSGGSYAADGLYASRSSARQASRAAFATSSCSLVGSAVERCRWSSIPGRARTRATGCEGFRATHEKISTEPPIAPAVPAMRAMPRAPGGAFAATTLAARDVATIGAISCEPHRGCSLGAGVPAVLVGTDRDVLGPVVGGEVGTSQGQRSAEGMRRPRRRARALPERAAERRRTRAATAVPRIAARTLGRSNGKRA